MTNGKICENCRYFSGLYNSSGLENEGECRFNPPIIFDNRSQWPKVITINWCGKWEIKDGYMHDVYPIPKAPPVRQKVTNDD